MKKIALPSAFSSLCQPANSGKVTGKVVLIATFIFLQTFLSHAQQTIGNFPEMEGGFENATAMDTTNATVAANYQLVKWRGATSTTTSIYTLNARTGTKSLQWLTGGSNQTLYSKSANSTAITNTTSYVVQFYWFKAHSSSLRSFNVSASPAGSAAFGGTVSTGNLGVSAPSFEWTKHTIVVTSGSSAVATRYGLIRLTNNGGSIPLPGYLFDDFCVYPGAAPDVTAPGDVTSPTITGYTNNSLSLSWAAPAGGVDAGGYVVIRYANNPTSEPSPNVNGIYATGQAIGTGSIVYIGNATSFTDNGLTANTAYYYKVYAVDQAFNYSINPTVFSGFTGIAAPTAITFTTPAICVTDRVTISWKGPLNYNSSNNTLLGFLKAGSAVTSGTPTNALSSYTANTTFGTGTAYQNDGGAYCIINGDGTNSAGDHSGLTITGLTPGTTYHLLLFNVVNATTSYSSGSTGNVTALNNLGEPANNPTTFSKGAVTTTNIPLAWTAATGSPLPTGYIINASNSTTPADPADFTDPTDQVSIATGSANAKTTGNNYSGFSGFLPGTMYYFKINSYTNAGACINFKAAGPAINVATLPNAVTSQLLNISGGVGTVNWTVASGYNNSTNNTLVFVSSSPITVGTPTANPNIYTANTTFNAGTAYQLDANAKCIYKGDGTSATVSGFIAGTTYYVLILTVVDAANYDATNSYSAYATTSAVYNATSEYTWIGGASASWAVAGSWTPTRNTPLATDVLIFNTAGNVTATNVPTETIAKLAINAGNVTLQSASASAISFTDNNGATFNDITVANGTSLILGTTVSITLNTNITADISGTLTVNSGNTYNTNNAGCITTVSGIVNRYGTVTSTVASRFVVNNGGVYNHAINGGVIPTGTWNFNSTCLISGITTADQFSSGSHGQTFSKFVWDCPLQNSSSGTSPAPRFVLGVGINTSSGPYLVVTDSMIIKRTNNVILQLTSSGGQRDFTVGNFYQYGGLFAITYDTDANGEQRSLTVNKTFYVTDSLEANTKFQIINTPGGENIIGRLFVGGDVEMHPTISASIIERVIGGAAALAEIWFNGNTPQYARFHTISGNVDFVNNHTSTGVTLLSDATANSFKLLQGTFFISSNTLTIKNAVTYPAPGTGTFGGSATSNLTLNGITGALNFYPGYRTLKDFTQTVGATASLGTELAIAPAGRDSLGINAVLTTNDNLILRSDASGTARLAQVPTTAGVAQATIVGKVAVERYLPMSLTYDSRRWRILTTPFKAATAPTIQAAWQEGTFCPDRFNPSAYDPKPGYGTHITAGTVAANGFDQGSTANTSIMYYINGSNSWTTPANTNVTKTTDNNAVYMIFVRGSRSIVIQNQFVPANPTTLDPKGELNLGDVSIPMLSSGFQPVGNPYASQVKLDNISFNGTLGKSKTIYFWDPKTLGANGVGAYATCSGDGGTPATYTYTGNGSNYGSMPGVIESSGAFMVASTSGNIVFHESDKTIASSHIGMASRPSSVKVAAGSLGVISKLYVDLVSIKNDEPSIADGIAVTYNKHYSNTIDEMDAVKLLTFATKEKISISKKEGLYSIERRNAVSEKDTIQFSISKLYKASYSLNFRADDFDDEYTAYLEDRYKKTSTQISLTENSSVSFSTTEDSLSSAANRFIITFKRNKPKVAAVAETNGIVVFPNPVTNGKINIKMNDMTDGVYKTRLVNNLGQVLHRGKLLHQAGNTNEVINISTTIAKGIYRLEIIASNKNITIVNVVIQ